ncbi:MAG: DUF389 domain-containing protein [Deltaproteobacteria bacterium]|nr:DUF389 domain-containing protein [Deltaproteobacteria bacterium]
MQTGDNSSDKKRPRRFNQFRSVPDTLIRTRRRFKESFVDLLSVDERRKDEVRRDIHIGSTPKMTYHFLLSISVLIAGFGLLTNSPAVVIGAMLVSPLMTPIFGISLGLVQGNFKLLRRAAVAEFGGVALAIAVAVLLGLLPFAQEVTPEMLTRTSPTLLDLLVATLAGMAGGLAMIDERISPVLPGIAMATALTPPLAVSGLCVAFGAYDGAWGAFLLFFANFLAILAVAACLFILAGFVTREEMGTGRQVVKRFAGPAVGLIMVTILLTHALIGIISERRTTAAIRAVVKNELASERGTSINNLLYDRKADKVDVLASVTTPQVISPQKIKQMQNKLDKALGTRTNLIMRCEITKDVSATGSASGVVGQDLDGEFVTTDVHPKVRRLQLAEQVLREILENYPNLYLDNLDLVDLAHEPVLVASVQTSRTLLPTEVARFEAAIRHRLGDDEVRLLVRCDDLVDVTSKGRILYGQAHFGKLAPGEKEVQHKVEESVRAQVMRINHMFAPNVDAQKKEDKWHVRAEVVGPRVLEPREIQAIEQKVSEAIQKPVSLHAWCRVELVVTGHKMVCVEDFTRELVNQKDKPSKLPTH